MQRIFDGTLSDDVTPLEVQMYLRDDLPPTVAERLEVLVDRLGALEQLPHISSVDIATWEPITELPSRHGRSRSQRTIAKFEQWAETVGLSLSPAFDHRSVRSALCDRTYERTLVPIVAMAMSTDDGLKFVAPSSDERSTYTVEDCLEIVAAHGLAGLEAICDGHSPPPVIEKPV